MRATLALTACACAIALTIHLCALLRTAQSVIASLPGEVAAARAALMATADARLASMERTADRRFRSLERTADKRLASIQADAREQIAGAVSRADARIGDGVAEIHNLRGDLRPVLASMDETLQQASGTVAVLRPQLLGFVAASKVTLGDVAQMSRTANQAFPRLITGADKIVANSDRTTDASARLMGNLAEATRPLPKWLRIGLGVAPPVVQSGAAAASIWALTK